MRVGELRGDRELPEVTDRDQDEVLEARTGCGHGHRRRAEAHRRTQRGAAGRQTYERRPREPMRQRPRRAVDRVGAHLPAIHDALRMKKPRPAEKAPQRRQRCQEHPEPFADRLPHVHLVPLRENMGGGPRGHKPASSPATETLGNGCRYSDCREVVPDAVHPGYRARLEPRRQSGSSGDSGARARRRPEEQPSAISRPRSWPRPRAPWARALPALRFVNTRTGASCRARLYADEGRLDEDAAAAIDGVLPERDAAPRRLDRRLLQLVVKAAAHFGATRVEVVSSFRDGARPGSRHRSGEALDFRLAGVTAARLAAFLRGGARVGVGVYTHRRTQFVHLDVREQSYHWADASPPGAWWRESRLTDRGASARDGAWRPEQDLTEAR